MKKNLVFTLIIVFVSFIGVFIMQSIKENKGNNGFNRLIKKIELKSLKATKLPPGLFYFAGNTPTKIYLKDVTNPNLLFDIDYQLNKLKKIDLKLGPDSNIQPEKINIGVERDHIYINNNKTKNLSIISIVTGKKTNLSVSSNNLDQSMLISKTSIINRDVILDKDNLLRQLVKFNINKDKTEKFFQLKKQVDGFFCTDGQLKFDPKSSKLFYMFFYRGEFLCLDTNLNLFYTGSTIDTNRIAKIKMAKLPKSSENKEKTLTQASPPLIVNRGFALANGNLYMSSALRADNESFSDFHKNQVVDVYNLTNGKYKYSFYIPKYKEKKLTELMIINEAIYAIFGNYILKFSS